MVTVQRSKSAQTPMHKKPTLKKPCQTPDAHAHAMVTRSSSMKHTHAHAQRNKAAVRRHGSVASDSPAKARTPTIKAQLATTPRRLDSGRLARGVEARLGLYGAVPRWAVAAPAMVMICGMSISVGVCNSSRHAPATACNNSLAD